MYASKQAENLASNFARQMGMTVEDFLSRAPEFEDRGIGPGSPNGWRARDVRALRDAIATQPVRPLGADEWRSSHPGVTPESRFTPAGLEAARELAAESGYGLNYIADYCVAGGAIDGSITRFDVDSAVAPRDPNLWKRFTGWITDFGRKLVSREGLGVLFLILALVVFSVALVNVLNRRVSLAIGIWVVGAISLMISLYFLVPWSLGKGWGEIIPWRPRWPQRIPKPVKPDWSGEGAPAGQEVQPWYKRWPWMYTWTAGAVRRVRNLSWPNNWPHPSRRWLRWGQTQQRVTAITILAVVLVMLIVLWPSPAPSTEPEPVAVMEEPISTEQLVEATESEVATAAVTDTVPITLIVVGRLKTVDHSQNVAGAEVVVEDVTATTDNQGEFNAPGVLETEIYHVEVSYGDFYANFGQEPRTGGRNVEGVRVDLGELPVVPVEVFEASVGEIELDEVEAETVAEAAAQTEAGEAENHTVTVEAGDTLWDLLEEELGHAPTWEQVKSVVDTNDLVDKGVNDAGLWIVLIYAGQTIDLAPALGG